MLLPKRDQRQECMCMNVPPPLHSPEKSWHTSQMVSCHCQEHQRGNALAQTASMTPDSWGLALPFPSISGSCPYLYKTEVRRRTTELFFFVQPVAWIHISEVPGRQLLTMHMLDRYLPPTVCAQHIACWFPILK